MRRGNEQEGFAVEFAPRSTVVRVAAWGFWGSAVASAFPHDVLTVSADARPGFGLLVDCTGLSPQRAEGQEAWSQLLHQLGGRVGPVFAVVPNAVTKLQLVRIAKTTRGPKWTFFPTINAASLAAEPRARS